MRRGAGWAGEGEAVPSPLAHAAAPCHPAGWVQAFCHPSRCFKAPNGSVKGKYRSSGRGQLVGPPRPATSWVLDAAEGHAELCPGCAARPFAFWGQIPPAAPIWWSRGSRCSSRGQVAVPVSPSLLPSHMDGAAAGSTRVFASRAPKSCPFPPPAMPQQDEASRSDLQPSPGSAPPSKRRSQEGSTPRAAHLGLLKIPLAGCFSHSELRQTPVLNESAHGCNTL